MTVKARKPRTLPKKRSYKKVLRRAGQLENQPQICFRVSVAEVDFLREAATRQYPKIARPMPRFVSEAALDFAAAILERPRPAVAQPAAVPA